MTPADRNRLQQILASCDDSAFIALANKGLVRRAQRELPDSKLSYEETDSAIIVRGSEWTVSMPPDGPSRASDSTKATGITWQILVAAMYLRDAWAQRSSMQPDAASPSLLPALLALTPDDLQKWAGKTAVREALEMVNAAGEVEVEEDAGIVIRLVKHEVEARLLPGSLKGSKKLLLENLLTTAPKTQHKRAVVAAVFALLRHHGLSTSSERTLAPESPGAVIDRASLLTVARKLFSDMIATGLAHPSERTRQQLATLGVSALAVNLPRLSRQLRMLADDVALILKRHASADTTRLFEHLAATDALATALLRAGRDAPASWVGRLRTEYGSAGDLPLSGVGAYPWRTASGFAGLTVVFWERSGQRFLTWSVSRPTAGPGRFNIDDIYRAATIWPGGKSLDCLCRSTFVLYGARVNDEGRLSATQQSRFADVSPTDPGSLDLGKRSFTDWATLNEYSQNTLSIGLADSPPLDRIVVLQPSSWGDRVFDELQQSFAWQLRDSNARSVRLTLPWIGVNESAIQFLEAVKPDRDRLTRVLARIGFNSRGLILEPLALWSDGTSRGDQILNPALDAERIISRQTTLLERLRKKFGRDRVPTSLTGDDEWDEGQMEGDWPAALPNLLAEVSGEILHMAEAGTRGSASRFRTRLPDLLDHSRRHGYSELSKSLVSLEKSDAKSSSLLFCGYVLQLYRRATLRKSLYID